MRKHTFDTLEIDRLQIKEVSETIVVPAVIAREIVQQYDGLRIYKPAVELEKAAWTAANAWVSDRHPDEAIISHPNQIRGTVRNPAFEDGKIKAELILFKNRCSSEFLEEVHNGERKDVSIGFFYSLVPEKGEFNGEHYDYVQKDILIDHVAVLKERGRCPFPACGIGVDALIGDPWEETDNEIRQRVQDPDKFDPNSFRRKELEGVEGVSIIVACPKGKWDGQKCTVGMETQAYRFDRKAGWTVEKAKTWYKEHVGDVAGNQEREELHEEAQKRSKKYGIKYREGAPLTSPEGYPTDPEDYGDPVNYAYPLKPEERAKNALARWGQFRATYSQEERNIIYERIVRACLGYGIVVRYNPDLPEAKALPQAIKEKLEGFGADFSQVKSTKIKSLPNLRGFQGEKTMSEEELKTKLEEAEEKISKLTAELDALKAEHAKTLQCLDAYRKAEKDALIKSILEKSTLDEKTLAEMDVNELRLILKAVDSAKVTAKSIRSAGAGTGSDVLTVGDLYHKE